MAQVMKKVVPFRSFSKRFNKEQSDLAVCLPRVERSKLVSHTWNNLAAACDRLYDQPCKTTKAVTQVIQEFELQKKEPSCQQVNEDPENSKEYNAQVRIKVRGVESKIESEESDSLKELLAEFEHQFSKVSADEKLRQCERLEKNIDREQKKLARSFFKRNLSKFLHTSFKSRSSKVGCLNDAKHGHALTLTDLCAWEEQLYHNVKKLQLEEKTGRLDKVPVAKRSVTWTINEIQNLRESGIREHLDQLQQSLTRFWGNNLESYKIQVNIMSEIIGKYDLSQNCVKVAQWKATEKLKSQLEDWRACFDMYLSSQKAHIDALQGWAKLPFPTCCKDEDEENKNSNDNDYENSETLLMALEKWSSCLEKLFGNEKGTKAIGVSVDKVGQLLELQDKEYEQNLKLGQLKVQWKNNGKSDKMAPRVKEEEEQHEALRQAIEKNTKDLLETGFAPLLEDWTDFSRAVHDNYNEIKRQGDALQAEV